MDRTPNAASVALIDGDRVLLIQRARAPYLGLWTLPGGRLEPGEAAELAAIREIREEVGLTCDRLLPVCRMWLGDNRRFLLQVFATQAFEGTVVPSDEVAAFRWVTSGGFSSLPTTPELDRVIESAFRLFDRPQMG